MFKHNQNGAVNGLVVSLVLAFLLLIGAIAFGGWAFSSRQDYKQNVDAKISDAVDKAKQQESVAKDKQFAEESKKPLRSYSGPEAYGSIVLQYPKTWSAYIDDTGKGQALIDGYFYPGIVPSLANVNTAFALRVQVINRTYSDTLSGFSARQKSGALSIKAYSLPKVPKVVGVRVVGIIQNNTSKTADMVVLPLRSQTIEIWTEGPLYDTDFSNSILRNFVFAP